MDLYQIGLKRMRVLKKSFMLLTILFVILGLKISNKYFLCIEQIEGETTGGESSCRPSQFTGHTTELKFSLPFPSKQIYQIDSFLPFLCNVMDFFQLKI